MKRLGASRRKQQNHPNLVRPPPSSKISHRGKSSRQIAVFVAVVCSVLVWYLRHQQHHQENVVTPSSGEIVRIDMKSKEQEESKGTSSHAKGRADIVDPTQPDEVKLTTKEVTTSSTGDVAATTKDRNPPEIVGIMPSCEGKTDFGKPQVREAFEATVALLDRMGVEYWLSAGTLLGFVRNCEHFDYDLDFAISLDWLNSPVREMKLVNIILQMDGRFRHGKIFKGIDGTTLSEGGEHKFIFEGNVKIDFFHSLRTPNFFRNGYGTEMGLLSCPRPLQRVRIFQWGNVEVPIPVPYEDVLQATYGDDYMTPQKRRKRKENFLWKATKGGCLVLRQGKDHRDGKIGIISCLAEGAEALTQATALVQSLQFWDARVTVEFYHRGTMSRKVQERIGHFLDYVHFVELPGDDSSGMDSQDLTKMFAEALAITSLEHALLVQPSIIFLRNPLHWVYTAEYIHKLDSSCSITCSHGNTCVTSTDWELGVDIKHILPKSAGKRLCIRSHANITTPKLIHEPSSSEVAVLHSSVHGVLNWAYPTITNYAKLVPSELNDQKDPFVIRAPSGEVQKLPAEYEMYLRHHQEAYKGASFMS